ncbi:MAG: NAD-dependent deacylase [Methylococcaceae bacterium]
MNTFNTPTIPTALIEKIKTAQHLVVLTGAGVSAESGIPTFRDALTGLWENYEAETLASENGFSADPALVWGWYEWRRNTVLQSKPNPAHETIAKLATKIPKFTLITQNVDDLHERAGNVEVLHLHGSLHTPRCFHCHAPYDLSKEITQNHQLKESRIAPSKCVLCGGDIRPGVVWFGEMLPPDVWGNSLEACEHCDLMLVVGTSGLVYPAANLPHIAHKNGATLVQVNLTINSLNGVATYNLHGKAGDILPKLYDATFLGA